MPGSVNKSRRIFPVQSETSYLFSQNHLLESEFKGMSEDELLFHSISQNIGEAIYRSMSGKGLVYINEAFVKMFGYSNEYEILNSNPENLYQNPGVRNLLAKEIETFGFITNREIAFKKKDGSVFIGSCTTTKVVGNDGVTYFDGAITDITARKKAEEELKYQAEMQRILINISSRYLNLPLSSIDEAMNYSLEEIGSFLGVDRLQIHSYDFAKNECVTTYEWCAPGIACTKGVGENVSIDSISDMVNCHFNGENVFISDINLLEDGIVKSALQAQEIKSALTVPLSLEYNCVGFIRLDSCHKKRTFSENELTVVKLFANMSVNIMSRSADQQKLNDLLETTIVQKKRLKDFSQITSHNVRASACNLDAINTILQKEQCNQQYLDYLDQSVEKLNESIYTINTLLNFENSYELMEKKPIKVSSSISRVIAQHKPTIKERGISFKNKVPNTFYVNASSAYLDDICHHLVSNAIVHGTSEHSRSIDIIYSVEGNKPSISIIDYGKGIDMDRHGNKLFKAGVKLHTDSCEGQGMGLFITKYMVETMGWEVEVESEVNKGTTFKIIFGQS